MKLTAFAPILVLSTACITNPSDDELGEEMFDEEMFDEEMLGEEGERGGTRAEEVCVDADGVEHAGDECEPVIITSPECEDAVGKLVPCEPGLPNCVLALRLEVTETAVPDSNTQSFMTQVCRKFSGEVAFTSVGAGAFRQVQAKGGFWDWSMFRLSWAGMCEQLAPAHEDGYRRKSVKLVLDHTDCPADVTAQVGVRGSATISASGFAEAKYGEVWTAGVGGGAPGYSWGARTEGKVYARAFTKEAGAEGSASVTSECTESDEIGLSGNVSAKSSGGITISHGQVCKSRVFDRSRVNLSLRATSDDSITLHYPVPGGNVPQFVEARSLGFEAQARSAMPAKGLWATLGYVSKIDAVGELATRGDTLTISAESCTAHSATANARCVLTTVGPNALRTR